MHNISAAAPKHSWHLHRVGDEENLTTEMAGGEVTIRETVIENTGFLKIRIIFFCWKHLEGHM